MSSKEILKPMLSKTKRAERLYTLEEYVRKEAHTTDKHEFTNGKISKMPYAKGPHNIIAANMIATLSAALEQLPDRYIIFSSDQKIYFPSLHQGVYADALAVCDTPQYWDDEKLLLINPLLVVEVLSKSTAKYDRNGKFDKYKTLDSLREYVLVRQDEYYAEAWFRERPGLWHESIVTALEAELPLKSLGIHLSMQRIYRNVSFIK